MSNPWWRVDLLDSYVITQIIVTNRGDCCEERINGAEIRIGNSNQTSQTINITGGMEGLYVTVVIPGSKKILTLCEVEVYGFKLEIHLEDHLQDSFILILVSRSIWPRAE
uniref:Fucolectin tachylectin-4 pentraxin-1 domain-containing protein n=1 Tax=Poecilia latipinna TaxID=48699 RepID=A0A3B3UD12_9TELE